MLGGSRNFRRAFVRVFSVFFCRGLHRLRNVNQAGLPVQYRGSVHDGKRAWPCTQAISILPRRARDAPPISRALERLSYSGRMLRSPRWLGMCVAVTGDVEQVYLHAVKFEVLGFSWGLRASWEQTGDGPSFIHYLSVEQWYFHRHTHCVPLSGADLGIG